MVGLALGAKSEEAFEEASKEYGNFKKDLLQEIYHKGEEGGLEGGLHTTKGVRRVC